MAILDALAPVSSLIPGVSATTPTNVPGNSAQTDVDYGVADPLSGVATTGDKADASVSVPLGQAQLSEATVASPSSDVEPGEHESPTTHSSRTNQTSDLIQPLAGPMTAVADSATPSLAPVPGTFPPPREATNGAAPAVSSVAPQTIPNGTYTPSQSSSSPSIASPSQGGSQALGAAAGQAAAIRPLSLSPEVFTAERPSVSAHDDSSGGSGDGPTLAQEYPDPDLMVSGDIIGGSGAASVTAPDGRWIISYVTWTISGAELGQSYTVPRGVTTDLGGPYTTFAGEDQSSVMTSFYWNYQPGDHAVSALVTYTDGSQTTVTGEATLAAPTVNAFSVAQTQAVFAINTPIGEGQTGPGISAAVTYSANVTMPNIAGDGTFGLIQMVSPVDRVVDQVDNNNPPDTEVHIFATDSTVLDNSPNAPDDLSGISGMGGVDTRQAVAAGTTVTLFSGVTDNLGVPAYAGTNEIRALEMDLDVELTDYLVFMPDGGIWVELAEAGPIDITGTAMYNANTGTYSATSASPAATTAGNPTLGFVSWNDYLAGNPAYTWDPAYQ